MKKAAMYTIMAISVILAVFAVLNMGTLLLHTLVDLLGYALYIGVFAAPAVYFWIKMKKTEKEEIH